jgi:hypothetical protein
MAKLKQIDRSGAVTFRELISTVFQVAPVAAVVFTIPLVGGFFAKLTDHMEVGFPSIMIALVGGVFLYRKRGSIAALLAEKARGIAKPSETTFS